MLFTAAVPAVIAEANDDDAVVTSDCRASDPEVRPAEVRVLVVAFQTSVASVPKVERVREV